MKKGKDKRNRTEGVYGREGVNRRDFIRLSGVALVGLEVGGLAVPAWARNRIDVIPASGGYILVDTKKCQGCTTCMMTCSLAHEGVESYSLSRIQILQNGFDPWPGDIRIAQCRQCVDPSCVTNCPTGAMHADPDHGFVRRVDRSRCIGCGICVRSCSFVPSRPIVKRDRRYGGFKKSRKCDLCVDTPYWGEEGGPGGKQACVEICPVKAIAFTSEIPVQSDEGYDVNLRDKVWAALGYPID